MLSFFFLIFSLKKAMAAAADLWLSIHGLCMILLFLLLMQLPVPLSTFLGTHVGKLAMRPDLHYRVLSQVDGTKLKDLELQFLHRSPDSKLRLACSIKNKKP